MPTSLHDVKKPEQLLLLVERLPAGTIADLNAERRAKYEKYPGCREAALFYVADTESGEW